jgi:hypothetical protein
MNKAMSAKELGLDMIVEVVVSYEVIQNYIMRYDH